ncbi:hypothetical protein ACFE04_030531 [Oxalis oulophora]
MEFDLQNPLPYSLEQIFLYESDHMPSQHYCSICDTSVRRQTISCILQSSYNMNPFVSYLAINYMDRFLSTQSILALKQPKPWILKLIAVSCVSLASKMKNPDFCLTHFQIEGFTFDIKTISRMEYVILDAIKWKMRSITPFSFVSLFISMFIFKDHTLMNMTDQVLKARAFEIIFKVQNDICYLEFKPSIIAGSALLFACHELFPLQFSRFNEEIFNCSCVNKGKMAQCYNLMQEFVTNDSQIDTLSSLDTPINVLDNDFSSDDNSSSSSNVRIERDSNLKRRKLNGDYEICTSISI